PLTRMPLAASPLVNAGNTTLFPSGVGNDQRGPGHARAFGTAVDIGAVEFQPPSVTVDQAAGQADPTSAGPITFTVVFGEPVTGFDASDVSFAGSTAGGTLVASVSGTGPTYTVSVTGMTGTGAVVASVPAGAATSIGTGLA